MSTLSKGTTVTQQKQKCLIVKSALAYLDLHHSSKYTTQNMYNSYVHEDINDFLITFSYSNIKKHQT